MSAMLAMFYKIKIDFLAHIICANVTLVASQILLSS
jgi:hypothetical protein